MTAVEYLPVILPSLKRQMVSGNCRRSLDFAANGAVYARQRAIEGGVLGRSPNKSYLAAFTVAIWSGFFAVLCTGELLAQGVHADSAALLATQVGACCVRALICVGLDRLLRQLGSLPIERAAPLSFIVGAAAATTWMAAVRLAIAPGIRQLINGISSPPRQAAVLSATSPATALFVFIAWITAWLCIAYAEELREKSAEAQVARDRVIALEALLGRPAALASASGVDHLWVPARGGQMRISVKDVLCLRAEEDYVRLRLRNGSEFLVRTRLRALHANLGAQRFVQVHRSSVVNVDCIAKIIRCGPRNLMVRLIDGLELPVSRSQIASVRKLHQG